MATQKFARTFKEFMLAAKIAAAIAVCFASASTAEFYYTINGKSVPKNIYDAAGLVKQSNVLIEANNLDRAAFKLKEALLIAPNLSAAHTNLGIILARKGKNADALRHLKAALKSEDCEPSAYMNLVAFYQATGDLEDAIATFKLYIQKSSAGEAAKRSASSNLHLLEDELSRRQSSGSSKIEAADYFVKTGSLPSVHWTQFRMPLKVHIGSANDLDGFKENYNDLLKQAFIDWEKASKGKITFLFVPQSDGCDIDCSWTNDPDKLANGSEAGNTITSSRAGVLAHAEIYLRSKQDEGSFPFNDNSVISTCRHEVGHALGISFHSPDADDLMYFTLPLADREQTIRKRDANTLEKVYAQPIPLMGYVGDYFCNPANLKTLGPFFTVSILFLGFLWLLLGTKKKRKKSLAG